MVTVTTNNKNGVQPHETFCLEIPPPIFKVPKFCSLLFDASSLSVHLQIDIIILSCFGNIRKKYFFATEANKREKKREFLRENSFVTETMQPGKRERGKHKLEIKSDSLFEIFEFYFNKYFCCFGKIIFIIWKTCWLERYIKIWKVF